MASLTSKILPNFDCKGVKISVFPVDFARHRYNSAAATSQIVISDSDTCLVLIVFHKHHFVVTYGSSVVRSNAQLRTL